MSSESPQHLTRAPTAADLATIGEAVLRELPPPFGELLGAVPIRVQDYADEATLQDLELDDPFDLLGLYRGVPLGHQVMREAPQDVDMIFLYRRPMLDLWCDDGEMTLEEIVRHVLIHEIGHHFGLSDEDMERIEAAVD